MKLIVNAARSRKFEQYLNRRCNMPFSEFLECVNCDWNDRLLLFVLEQYLFIIPCDVQAVWKPCKANQTITHANVGLSLIRHNRVMFTTHFIKCKFYGYAGHCSSAVHYTKWIVQNNAHWAATIFYHHPTHHHYHPPPSSPLQFIL